MTDTVINLGGFTFQNLEIPKSINFGGEQKLNIHELVGGVRIIDVMGKQDMDISWEGLMLGPDALDRALQLDSMRVAGEPINLSWFSLNYLVLIKHFKAETERYYQVSYSITLEIAQDLSSVGGVLSILGIDDSILGDFVTASGIATTINNPTLSSLMTSLGSAINAVPTFSNASQATINSVLTPLSNVQATVSSQQIAVQSRLFGI